MATSIFLDTNVFLAFYHFSDDDLQALEKLYALMKNKEVTLILPQQTKEEFKRNRENKIHDAIKKIREEKLITSFPQICKEFEKPYSSMRKAIKMYEENKQEIITEIVKSASKKTLKADILLEKLFKKAEYIKSNQDLVDKAKLRYDVGNPPGKDKSYGDAIIWEALLSRTNQWEDFFFISDDKDYYSVLDPEKFNSFLIEEWSEKTNSDLRYYRRLSQFLKENYPQIIIASEYEKDTLINKLSGSNSFARTHSIIRELSEYDSFTQKQVNDIVYAAISNSQIFWIADDPPIKRFIQEIYDDFWEDIDEVLLSDLIDDYDIDTSA